MNSETRGEDRPYAREMVRLEHVSLSYDGMPSLIDADFRINQGEFAAVVGPSGCGKSTIMRLVTGLMPPTAGNIFFDGREVSGPIRGAGMAFQNANLLPWRTTIKNVSLPLEIVKPFKSTPRSKAGLLRDRAMALLESVGLEEFADKLPWQLSGGMQQRANLCRALIHEPKLIMLDEPFAALDAFTKEDLWRILQDLWIERKFSAILVTHDLREAVYLADTVYVMSKRPGQIIHRVKVDLPRPRDEATTFTSAYMDIVNDLRSKISAVRNKL
jgi:NitT/TauT family transport system ATP-binding protein